MGMKRRLSSTGTLLGGALFAASLANAFVPTPTLDRLEVLLPQERSASTWDWLEMQAERALVPGTDEYLSRYGGSWRFQRNQATGTAHMVVGSGTDMAPSIASEVDVETAARRFFRDNTSLFGTTDSDLIVDHAHNGLGKWSVVFHQEHEGVPVYGGRAHAVFTEGGRLFVAGSDFHPAIDISTTPSIPEAEAIQTAAEDIGFNGATDLFESSELLVVPIIENGQVDYRLAYDVKQRVQTPFGLWSTFVNAENGQIFRRVNLLKFADVQGNVDADVYDPHYCGNPLVPRELSDHNILFTGLGTAVTDLNGDFVFNGLVGSAQWSAALDGPWAKIFDITGADPAQIGTVDIGDTLQVNWNTGNSENDERTCFYHTNIVHNYIRGLDPGPTLDDIDYQYPVTVGNTGGLCPGNAWYDFIGINFCVGDPSFGNTGELSDVIYHEYGHGITHRIYDSQASPPGDLHEGNSDVVANLLTDESIIGLGFFLNNCTGGIRNSDNTLQYPADWTGANHFSGQILAGVVWDAWQELKLTNTAQVAFDVIGNVWHHGRAMILPTDQPGQVLSMLIADDDDGNLTNGTPHWTEICIGAANHGHDCSALVGLSPEIAVSPALLDVTTPAGTMTNDVIFVSNVGTGFLTYNLAGVAAPFTKSVVAGGVVRGIPNQGPSVTANRERTYEFLQRSILDRRTKVAAVIYSDDMESGLNGWTTTLEDASTDDLWHQQTTNFNSPTTSWWCGISGGSDYNTGNRISNALVSTSIALNGSAPITLSFYESYNTEGGWDFCNVDVSVNGGAWLPLRSGTSGSSGGWKLTTLDLSAHNDNNVRIRFHFDTTDGFSNANPGWFVDDVSISADGVEWLAFAPAGGSLAAGETDTVTVTFDATALTPADYNANIDISSNDLSDPTVTLPATLHVTGGSVVDPDSSSVSITAGTTCPAGDADSIVIKVTILNGSGAPIVGVPAGDVVVNLTGLSSLGQAWQVCGEPAGSVTLVSTAASDSTGCVWLVVNEVGGCAALSASATVSGTPLTAAGAGSVRSVDFNGDGDVNFFDTFLYLPDLIAGTGNCGNLNGDVTGDVNFFDTNIYLTHLVTGHQCP